jgi:nucleoside-diphosphate-sugar epimerase
MMGYNEVEAAVRHFVFGEGVNEVLSGSKHWKRLIGLRQIAEIVVPRERLRYLEQNRCLEDRATGRALVTGASGYMGQPLVRALLGQGIADELVAPVRNPEKAQSEWSEEPEGSKVRWVRWDLSKDLPHLDEMNLVVIGAAVRPDGAENLPHSFEDNVKGVLNLIKGLRYTSVRKVIFLSSQAVYGQGNPPPWDESTPLAPEGPYAWSKAAGEALVETLDGGNIRWAILRLARLYGLGPGVRWFELPHRFARLAARGAPLPIHGDGGQKMDFLHVNDAVHACMQLLKQPATSWNQIYNIGSGSPVSVRALAETCVSLAREKGIGNPSIEWAEDVQQGRSFGMRIEKAERFLDWRPAISLRSGLTELMDDAFRTV